MLIAGLETEVADYIARHQELVDEAGHRLVVPNGKAVERSLVTGTDALKVRAPRVSDSRERYGFSSYILPRYARRSPKVGNCYRSCICSECRAAISHRHSASSSGRMLVSLSATSITRLGRDLDR
jgi:hypothetical protein